MTADQALCRELLPLVSRTFALSIEALPEDLRGAVRVAYLLCRLVDSIEDAVKITPPRRTRLFDAFDAAVSDDGATIAPLGLDGARGLKEAERRLADEAPAVLRVFRTLPPRQREAIRPRVLEMSRGMREYTARPAAPWGGVAISTLDDLERYCYFVAGTVGELLTDLFLQHVHVEERRLRRALRERAVSFGVGLQLVNIVKDVAGDHERGACFLPLDLAEQHGLVLERLLDPDQRGAGLAVIEHLVTRAREHLARASEYTGLWPVPRGAQVRLFCSVPLALALATLAEVARGDDTLRPGKAPAISRETVLSVFRGAQRSARYELAAAR
jgi:farnesyl-diphosphate farnesyltransferase